MSILKPVLVYGSETWPLTKKIESKIGAAEMRVLRLIVGVTKRDKIRNTTIRTILNITNVIDDIKKSQLRWFGHLQRMENDRDPLRIYNWTPNGQRPVGRPRNDWKRTVEKNIKDGYLNVDMDMDLCQNREEWRTDGQN